MFFSSFFVILDFLDFCAPVYALRKSRKNHQNFVGFWQNLGIPKTLRQLYIDPKIEEKAVGGNGTTQESRNFKISQNVFKQPKTIIESRVYKRQYRRGPYRARTGGGLQGPQTPP